MIWDAPAAGQVAGPRVGAPASTATRSPSPTAARSRLNHARSTRPAWTATAAARRHGDRRLHGHERRADRPIGLRARARPRAGTACCTTQDVVLGRRPARSRAISTTTSTVLTFSRAAERLAARRPRRPGRSDPGTLVDLGLYDPSQHRQGDEPRDDETGQLRTVADPMAGTVDAAPGLRQPGPAGARRRVTVTVGLRRADPIDGFTSSADEGSPLGLLLAADQHDPRRRSTSRPTPSRAT